jgi:hypothetical protein
MNELHFAVIVGINCYPGIKNQLTTARQDAEAFAGWLTSPNEGGLRTEHVKLITTNFTEEQAFIDFSHARPVRQEVLEALVTFHGFVKDVDTLSWERTRLYIYVAGMASSHPRDAAPYCSPTQARPSTFPTFSISGSMSNYTNR